MTADLAADFATAMTAALAGDRPAVLGVAVSGGGDSVALLHLARAWAAAQGVALTVATVDHRLRPEAADEARAVAVACQSLSLPHDPLIWDDWDGRGNVQAQARAARRRLLSDWAQRCGIAHVLLGHTADDQAETVLMELGRRAGAAGLSGMVDRRAGEGVIWLRPLLGARRAALRDWLRGQGIGWIDDPSNDDPRFARIRARAALAAQPGAAQALTDLAQARRREVTALNAAAAELARACTPDRGEWRLPLTMLEAATPDLRRHLIGAALRYLAPPGPAPRGSALTGFLDRIAIGEGGPLHGVIARIRRGHLILTRDRTQVTAVHAPAGLTVWDRHWHIRLAEPGQIAPLGPAGVARLADWRATGLTRSTLMAAPGLWVSGDLRGAALAPLADGTPPLDARWAATCDDFSTLSFAH